MGAQFLGSGVGTLELDGLAESTDVTHYVRYINDPQTGRTSGCSVNGNGFSGGIEDVYYGHVDRRFQEEQLAQGRLEPKDVETKRSPVIVEITLAVDGKTHTVRGLFTPDQKIFTDPKDPQTRAALHAALDKAIQQLIAELLIT